MSRPVRALCLSLLFAAAAENATGENTLMEAGHAGGNVFLQAEALGPGAGIVGAFDDAGLAAALHLPRSHEPLAVMPVGHPRDRR